MKKSLLFAAAFGLSLLAAAPVTPDINGNFANNGKDWYVQSRNLSATKVLPTGEFVLYRKPKAPYADLVYGKGFEIKPGDKVVLTVVAKGEGTAYAGLTVNGVGNCTDNLPLKPEFTEQKVVVNLSRAQAKLPQKAQVKFIVAGKVQEITIKSCKVVINPED